jgi:uncharacterized SAM-binding protein YcdF (DUF218 family)
MSSFNAARKLSTTSGHETPATLLPDPDERSGSPSRGWRRALRWGGVAGVLLGIYLARVPILTSVAAVLSVDDPLQPADAIFVLGGDLESRVPHAAELYRRGLAPRVVLPRVHDTPSNLLGLFPNETDASVRYLRWLGVPDSAIVVIRSATGVTSTSDESDELRKYLSVRPAERILVVTNRYHTRRARWSLRRGLQGVPVELRMAGVDHLQFRENNWWHSEEGLIRYFEEYLKFVHNWLYR